MSQDRSSWRRDDDEVVGRGARRGNERRGEGMRGEGTRGDERRAPSLVDGR